MNNFYLALIFVLSVCFITTVQADNSIPIKARKAKDIAESPLAKSNCILATQREMNECTAEQFKNSDDDLNHLYKEKLEALTVNRDSFRDMQRAWLVFRDKACIYEAGPREGGGSIWPSQYFNCMKYHTKKRIEDLKKYIECTQNGCPG